MRCGAGARACEECECARRRRRWRRRRGAIEAGLRRDMRWRAACFACFFCAPGKTQRGHRPLTHAMRCGAHTPACMTACGPARCVVTHRSLTRRCAIRARRQRGGSVQGFVPMTFTPVKKGVGNGKVYGGTGYRRRAAVPTATYLPGAAAAWRAVTRGRLPAQRGAPRRRDGLR